VSKIYLASASPRRQALLRQLGVPFDVVVPVVVEKRGPAEGAAEYARRLAAEKAHQAARQVATDGLKSQPILAADTCVVVGGKIFGKPQDRTDAEAMLRRLSGREHTVLTAVTLLHGDKEHSALNVSQVTLRRLTDEEIRRYWETGEPADKAGAYAIQGRAAAFVSRIEGSYSGIVGLPLYEVAQLLAKIGLNCGE
jgi:septum formation protein